VNPAGERYPQGDAIMPYGLDVEWGTTQYMIMSTVGGSLLLLLCTFLFKKFIRIEGIESWLILAVLGPAAALLAMPIISITNVPLGYSVPIASLAFLLTIPVIHFLVPNVAPDFQTESFGMSLVLSLMIGLATFASLHMNYELEGLVPTEIEGVSERETQNFLQ
jgi:hypothetical protein